MSIKIIKINTKQLKNILSFSTIIGFVYAIGVFTNSVYFFILNIRFIELFKVKYLFIGIIITLYFIIFLFLKSFIVVASVIYKLKYSTIELFSIALFRQAIIIFSIIILNNWNFYSFVKNWKLVLLVLITPFFYDFSSKIYKKKKQLHIIAWAIILILVILIICFYIMLTFIYPKIPDHFGGGAYPYVEIIFTDDTPFELRHPFDINKTNSYSGPVYHGQIIFTNEDKIFLKVPFEYSMKTLEFSNKNIKYLRFIEKNP